MISNQSHLQRLADDVPHSSVLQRPGIHALLQPAAQHLRSAGQGSKGLVREGGTFVGVVNALNHKNGGW